MLQVHQRQILETLQETRLNLLLELLRFIIAPSSSSQYGLRYFQALFGKECLLLWQVK